MNGLPMAGVLPISLPNMSADRLSALFDAHYDRLYCLARRLAPDADAARDLVQETFLKVAASPTSVPAGLTDEEAWLVRVLINIRRDQWRKSAVRKRYEGDLRRSTTVRNDPEGALVARATVWRALDTLTPRRRAVVVMREIDGLSFPAIASLLGISAITVRWHLSMGRRDLARILRPHMGATNDDR
jgi:RNA polymerase sigma-70 factor (ECF subfamily)